MNKKTLRLLNAYSLVSDKSGKELREWWRKMNSKERTGAREMIRKKLAGE